MKKFIVIAAFCFSSSSFAESAVIFNNSHNGDQMIVRYQECGRPVKKISHEYLDCLPGISTLAVSSGRSAAVTIDPGYFVNIIQVIEKDTAGYVRAEAQYGAGHRCEVFGSVELVDDGRRGIVCSQ